MSDNQQAQRFERNEFYEAILLLKRDEPKRFMNLSEATRRTVEIYAEQKRLHTQETHAPRRAA